MQLPSGSIPSKWGYSCSPCLEGHRASAKEAKDRYVRQRRREKTKEKQPQTTKEPESREDLEGQKEKGSLRWNRPKKPEQNAPKGSLLVIPGVFAERTYLLLP